jgi:hypothetical protein
MDMDVDLEFELKISRRDLRVLLLHEFRLGHKATETTSNICWDVSSDLSLDMGWDLSLDVSWDGGWGSGPALGRGWDRSWDVAGTGVVK